MTNLFCNYNRRFQNYDKVIKLSCIYMYEKSYRSFMKNLNFVLTTLLHVSCNISVTTLFSSLEKIHVISLLRKTSLYYGIRYKSNCNYEKCSYFIMKKTFFFKFMILFYQGHILFVQALSFVT